MRDWRGTDVLDGLSRRLGWAVDVPIKAQNDVDAHAVGESWRGAGVGASSMVPVAIGTGIGSAFCVAGQVWRGAHSMAGEIGSTRYRFDDGLPETLGDDGLGDFQVNAAGPAILRCYRALGGMDGIREAEDVADLAQGGDELAMRVIDGLGRRVGRVLSGLVLALDPEVMVLGGGVPTPESPWWIAMEDELRAGLPEMLRDVPVKLAQRRSSAALLGAARDAFRLAGVPTG